MWLISVSARVFVVSSLLLAVLACEASPGAKRRADSAASAATRDVIGAIFKQSSDRSLVTNIVGGGGNDGQEAADLARKLQAIKIPAKFPF